jgi:hypothetical protein
VIDAGRGVGAAERAFVPRAEHRLLLARDAGFAQMLLLAVAELAVFVNRCGERLGGAIDLSRLGADAPV